MLIRTILTITLCCACAVYGPKKTEAAVIEVEYSNLGILIYESMVVHISGEILPGDAQRIGDAVDDNVRSEQRGIIFSFDSPGGNLLEGVKIGRLISNRPEITTSMVGTTNNPNAICASACVFAYLGSETREKSSDGRIGLHQFYIGNNTMGGAEALGAGQQISAIVASYMAERKASAEIFDRMVLTDPGDIDWVSDADLSKMGIVGGSVIHQSSEFINNGGKSALQMSFMSSSGSHTLVLGCNSDNPGIYMVASIVSHDDAGEFSDVALIVDEERINPINVNFIVYEDRKIVLIFGISIDHANLIGRSNKLGAYYYSSSINQWFGNMQEIDQYKFSNLVSSC
jgi:hypothetical protein